MVRSPFKIKKFHHLKNRLDYRQIVLLKTKAISSYLESCFHSDEIFIDYECNLTQDNILKVQEIIEVNPPYKKINNFLFSCYDTLFDYERKSWKTEVDNRKAAEKMIEKKKINARFKFLGDYNFSTCLNFFD